MTQANLTHNLIDYHQGNLTDEQTIDLFRYLVRSSIAWQMDDAIQVMAQRLIELGFINVHKEREH